MQVKIKIRNLLVQSCNFRGSLISLEREHLAKMLTSVSLPEETLMVMTSSPSLLLTVQVTVKFTLGTTVILCVALPLMYELSS